MLMNRRLYRCRDNKMLAGVAGGVAEYFDLDPSLVRILFVVSIFFGGIGLLLYIGMAIIVPLEPASAGVTGPADPAGDAANEAATTAPEGHRHATRGDGPWTTLIGGALILFGSLALIDRFLPALDVEHFVVPVVMIGIGVFLLMRAVRREPMET
jgi:phage shock protein C